MTSVLESLHQQGLRPSVRLGETVFRDLIRSEKTGVGLRDWSELTPRPSQSVPQVRAAGLPPRDVLIP